MGKLDGKIAVITGGSSGIGFATAQRFVAEGAYVFLTGRRQSELDAAVARLEGNATGIQGDVSSQADIDRLYAAVKQEKGHVDIVFANAGIAGLAPLGSIAESQIDAIFNVNVKGLIFTVQSALPLLRPGSSIILNASIVASKGFAGWSVYSATKAAVRSFARTWSADLKGRGIRVNAVSPGVVPTPGYQTLGLPDEQIKAFEAHSASITPLERTGTVDEVAKAVSFLASDDSSFITGIELFVDGGIAQI